MCYVTDDFEIDFLDINAYALDEDYNLNKKAYSEIMNMNPMVLKEFENDFGEFKVVKIENYIICLSLNDKFITSITTYSETTNSYFNIMMISYLKISDILTFLFDEFFNDKKIEFELTPMELDVLYFWNCVKHRIDKSKNFFYENQQKIINFKHLEKHTNILLMKSY